MPPGMDYKSGTVCKENLHDQSWHQRGLKAKADVGGGAPPILPDGFYHSLLEVGAQQVVLTDVHEADAGVLQVRSELLPSTSAYLWILAKVEGPDAALLEHIS